MATIKNCLTLLRQFLPFQTSFEGAYSGISFVTENRILGHDGHVQKTNNHLEGVYRQVCTACCYGQRMCGSPCPRCTPSGSGWLPWNLHCSLDLLLDFSHLYFFYNSIASRNVCYLVLLLPTYISIAEWALDWFLPGFVGEATGIIWARFCVHYMSVNILVSSVQS